MDWWLDTLDWSDAHRIYLVVRAERHARASKKFDQVITDIGQAIGKFIDSLGSATKSFEKFGKVMGESPRQE